ncbi:uncharacterized protein V1510DRAFT_428364 [Dipodascopsis tothii]|uniref:uncharacterized protein n=1 Tax=Dipodascopsis tothii TaxID=44089 RepID=UPI0034CFA56D
MERRSESQERGGRTLVGSYCAVCDEPLQYTIHGERIVRFGCGHNLHDLCLRETLRYGAGPPPGPGRQLHNQCPQCEQSRGTTPGFGPPRGRFAGVDPVGGGSHPLGETALLEALAAGPPAAATPAAASSTPTASPPRKKERRLLRSLDDHRLMPAASMPLLFIKESIENLRAFRNRSVDDTDLRARRPAESPQTARADPRGRTASLRRPVGTPAAAAAAPAPAGPPAGPPAAQTKPPAERSTERTAERIAERTAERAAERPPTPLSPPSPGPPSPAIIATAKAARLETVSAAPPGRFAVPAKMKLPEIRVEARPHARRRVPPPAPQVVVQAELPVLTRSRKEQSLTCLVRVAVPDQAVVREGGGGGGARTAGNAAGGYMGGGYVGGNAAGGHTTGGYTTGGNMPGGNMPGGNMPGGNMPATNMPATNTPRGCPGNPAIPATPDPAATHDATPASPGHDLAEDAEADHVRAVLQAGLAWRKLKVDSLGDLRLWGSYALATDVVDFLVLDFFLFDKMLVCTRDMSNESLGVTSRMIHKGSILTKDIVAAEPSQTDDTLLTLHMTSTDSPRYYIQFRDQFERERWRFAFANPGQRDIPTSAALRAVSVDGRTAVPLQPTAASALAPALPPAGRAGVDHHELDIVLAVPVTSSMHGLKMSLVQDAVLFLVSMLGPRDRLGIVAYSGRPGHGGALPSGDGATLRPATWDGWKNLIAGLQPLAAAADAGPADPADPLTGAALALDVLGSRRERSPVASVLVISDSPRALSATPTADRVGRYQRFCRGARALNVSVHCFGMGLSHAPDDLVELSNYRRTARAADGPGARVTNGAGGSYTYVRDWTNLRECLAGCVGLLFAVVYRDVRLVITLADGFAGRLLRITAGAGDVAGGVAAAAIRPGGREAEVSFGECGLGDVRDVLVKIEVPADRDDPADAALFDPWDDLVSELVAVAPADDSPRRCAPLRVKRHRGHDEPAEVAVLSVGVACCEPRVPHAAPAAGPRPPAPVVAAVRPHAATVAAGLDCYSVHAGALLTVVLLPAPARGPRPLQPVLRHPVVVQRQVELLAVEVLGKALALVAGSAPAALRRNAARATAMLSRCRQLIIGLSRGPLPLTPSPEPPGSSGSSAGSPRPPSASASSRSSASSPPVSPTDISAPSWAALPAVGVDDVLIRALTAELDNALEWLSQNVDMFLRDTRKSVLQTIAAVDGHRGASTRTAIERFYVGRVAAAAHLVGLARDWPNVH